jgi:glycosyltransferase involved in cell wall biosynthesis
MQVSIVNVNIVRLDAIGQTLLNQTRFFQRRGHQVQVYVMHEPEGVPNDLRSLIQVVTLDDLLAHRDPHFAHSDLYIYHYPTYYSLLDSMRSLERGAVIFYFHNVTPPDLWGSTYERDHLAESVARVATIVPYADLVVTASDYSAEQLVRDHGADREQIRVLPYAVPLDRFSPGPRDETLLQRYQLYGKRVVLFVGRMAGNKRVDLLIEALPLIRQQVPNAILLLAGDDHSNPALQETTARARARAKDLGIAEYVIFTGPVDTPSYCRLADVYASASLHEGFGIPLIEAMASGVPVVASKATAHPWVLNEAGLLAEPEQAADLARQIVRVLTDDALHGELVQRGLARAREFSLEHYENGWAKIVAEATAWLPEQPYPRMQSISTLSPHRAAALAQASDLQWLDKVADVMQRNYVVRSNAPIVGSLIAWVRRNLTSHLREPYVDPTFERQVAFNREVVSTLQRHQSRIESGAAQSDSSADSARRISQLETQLAELQQQVAALQQTAANEKQRK